MRLFSNDFKNNELLHKKFTCDAEDFSPHLKWTDIPKDTKSFAITCIDPNTDYGIMSHWNVCNISLDIREIPQGGPVPGLEIENDFSSVGYEGPCPESGKHQYIFTVYALDITYIEDINPQTFRKILREHTIDSAELIGFYERQFDVRSFRRISCR